MSGMVRLGDKQPKDGEAVFVLRSGESEGEIWEHVVETLPSGDRSTWVHYAWGDVTLDVLQIPADDDDLWRPMGASDGR